MYSSSSALQIHLHSPTTVMLAFLDIFNLNFLILTNGVFHVSFLSPYVQTIMVTFLVFTIPSSVSYVPTMLVNSHMYLHAGRIRGVMSSVAIVFKYQIAFFQS